jgi:hypothetical protein
MNMDMVWLFLLPMTLTVLIGFYLQTHPLPDKREIERRMDDIEEKIIYWLNEHWWKK